MHLVLDPTLQTIHCSSAGRAGVLAQFLAPDSQLESTITVWVERLIVAAADLAIALNTRDVRWLLTDPMADLEDVLAKSHPTQLRDYGAMNSATTPVLEQWCACTRGYVSALVRVVHPTAPPAATCTPTAQPFPETLVLSRYQRNALGAYLQVANDALVLLESLTRLACTAYPPLFNSSLTATDLAHCQEACKGLASLFAWGHRWMGEKPVDRRRSMVREHLEAAHTALMLLFEGIPERQRRQVLAGLLIGLANLKRRM